MSVDNLKPGDRVLVLRWVGDGCMSTSTFAVPGGTEDVETKHYLQALAVGLSNLAFEQEEMVIDSAKEGLLTLAQKGMLNILSQTEGQC